MTSRLIVATLFMTLLSVSLAAQTAPSRELSLMLRTRAEAWSWFDTPGANDEYLFSGTLARIAYQQKMSRGAFRVEAAVPILLGLPDDATAPAPAGALGLGANYFQANGRQDIAGIVVRQAFVDYGTGTRFRLGRFEFMDGTEPTKAGPALAATRSERVAHRLIGNFGFSHVQRSFDGVHVQHTSGPWQFTGVVVRPTEGVFAVRKTGNLDIDVLYGSAGHSTTTHDARFFILGYRDDRNVVKTDNRPVAIRNADREAIELVTVGGHWLSEFSMGGVRGDFLAWAALQDGDWGTVDHSAHAVALEASLRLGPKANRIFRGGVFQSSGDDDPSDGKHETFFAGLPTPRLHARFPFYNSMNQQDAFVELSSPLSAKLSARAAVHALRLTEERDLWYAGGGAFVDENFGYAGRTSSGQSELATVVDFAADYKLTPRVTVSGYLAHAAGGDVIDSIYASNGGRYGYLELTYRFSKAVK